MIQTKTKYILKAVELLQNGQVVAIPTETVYGLAANAFDDLAVEKIFEIKKRPLFNPLIVHIKSVSFLEKIASNIPETAYKLAAKFWPGPLTLILEKKAIVPNCVTSGKNTVGVRIPSHPLALALLNKLEFPLAAPSANPFGYISPTTSAHVKSQLGDKIPYILEGGPCEKGIESTIIGFENNEPILYRVGALTVEEIEKCIGKLRINNTTSNKPIAPGMLNKHYSPKTKFIVSKNIQQDIAKHLTNNVGFLLFKNEDSTLPPTKFIELSSNKNLAEAATRLYAAMHQLDAMNFDVIFAERFPELDLGKTINDRLNRAQVENFDFNNNQ